jgi:hypothetical protein
VIEQGLLRARGYAVGSAFSLGLVSLAACLGSSSSGSPGAAESSGDQTSSGASTSPTSTSPGGSGAAPSSGSSSGTSSGSSSESDSGSPATGTGVALSPDPSGYIDPSSNTLGIQGAWFAYGDCWGTNGAPPGDCETKGMHATSACSSITSPMAGMAADDGGFMSTFPQTTPGTMCLSGTAAKVVGGDYSNMFGNNQNGVTMTYDATANHVVGFSFHLSGIPAASPIRIELDIPATDTSGDAWSMTAMADGDYTVDLTSSASDPHPLKPSFSSTTAQPAFDATKLEAIQFHVVTNITAAITIPMGTPLCVSNFQAIVGN